MVNDTYQELSTKNNTKNQRGEDNIKTVIERFEPYMAARIKRENILENAKNKEELIYTIYKI